MKNGTRALRFPAFALLAAVFLLATSASSARSLFSYGGRSRVPVFSNYYAPATGYTRDYQAALTRPPVRSFGGNTNATDYLSSVCGEGTYTWQSQHMPIKVFISDGTGVPGYKPVFQDYIRNGFTKWCNISENKLAWVEVKTAAEADVTVAWTDRVTERPEGTEAGRTSVMTRYNAQTGKGIIYGARMQFLTQLPSRGFDDAEVEKTCLHEAGHALGLQGHSPFRNDIMYYAVGPSQQPMLSDRDRNTMMKLYTDAPTLDAVALGHKAQPLTATQTAQ
jgi:predicted Zn-dependent protease